MESSPKQSECRECETTIKNSCSVCEKQEENIAGNKQTSSEAVKNNWHYGLEIAQKEYEMRLNRIRDVDNKLNMMLVIFAALLAALGLVVDSTSIQLDSGKKAIIVFTFFVLLFSMIIILIGLYPRQYQMLSSKALIEEKTFDKDEITFAQDYLFDYSDCIKSIEKIMKSKLSFLQISAGFNVLTFILLIIIVIV